MLAVSQSVLKSGDKIYLIAEVRNLLFPEDKSAIANRIISLTRSTLFLN